jgi:pimeloyl-ACP methyl ester carboxylesterase
MTFERMLADTEEMIEWLRKEFGKQKIFVLGHSWGSFLGLKTAERHPQWLHAYIGMGQGANMPESERRGWKFAMERARAAKWLTLYGGVMSGRQSNAVESAAVLLSPEYSDAEIRRVWDGNEFSENLLLAKVVALDLSTVTELKCPVILLAGRDDYNASSSVAAEWFERLRAPSKKFVWFEHTAHEVMNEAPGKTLVSLVKYALPLAEHAGDVAPQGLQ